MLCVILSLITLWAAGPTVVQGQTVTGLTLIDAQANQPIRTIADGEDLNLAALPAELNVRADVSGDPGSVQFTVNESNMRTENVAPFALAGDNSGDYNFWDVQPGTYEITATPYSESHTGGAMGTAHTVTVTVVEESTDTPDENSPPSFTSTPITAATEGDSYAYAVGATDPDGDMLTLSATTVPDWLSFTDNGDGTGTLEGTPAAGDIGSHDVMLVANDGNAAAAQSFTINVAEPSAPGAVQVTLSDVAGAVGEQTTVPVHIDGVDAHNVQAFEFELTYDASILNITGVQTSGTLSADYSVEANTGASGTVIVAGAGSSPLPGAGVLLELQVELTAVGTGNLVFENFTANEGTPSANTGGGTVTVESDEDAPDNGDGGDQERQVFSASSDQFPIYFGSRIGVQRSATLELDPSNAEDAELIITAYDINSTSEAAMYVNGTAVSIPTTITGFGESKTGTVTIDPALLTNGSNTVTFETNSLVDGAQDNFRFRIEALDVALLYGTTGDEDDSTDDGEGGGSEETTTERVAFNGDLPLFFGDRIGVQRSVTASLNPAGIVAADVEVTAYDINSTGEAVMYVNGTEVSLPDAIVGFGESKTAAVTIEPELLASGTNTITFETNELVDGEANFFRFKVEDVTVVAETTGDQPLVRQSRREQTVQTARTGGLPDTFALDGNYPNPANPTTNIRVDLPAAARVSVTVYDMLGREVMEIAGQQMPEGSGRSLQIDVSSLSSGAYLYRVIAEMGSRTAVETGRMSVIK